MARTAVLEGSVVPGRGGSRGRTPAGDAVSDRQQAALQSQVELVRLRRDADRRRDAAPGSTLVAELERLAGLRASGALSAEEFGAAKAKLLG